MSGAAGTGSASPADVPRRYGSVVYDRCAAPGTTSVLRSGHIRFCYGSKIHKHLRIC
jgi:hypothetical protein